MGIARSPRTHGMGDEFCHKRSVCLEWFWGQNYPCLEQQGNFLLHPTLLFIFVFYSSFSFSFCLLLYHLLTLFCYYFSFVEWSLFASDYWPYRLGVVPTECW